MSDIHKMAMTMSLLRRQVPMEVAALAADAVHPFAELGNWAPDRKGRKEAQRVSTSLASTIGRYPDAVPIEELKAWTRSAFAEYAQIAGTDSQAGRVFAEAAGRAELTDSLRQDLR